MHIGPFVIDCAVLFVFGLLFWLYNDQIQMLTADGATTELAGACSALIVSGAALNNLANFVENAAIGHGIGFVTSVLSTFMMVIYSYSLGENNALRISRSRM